MLAPILDQPMLVWVYQAVQRVDQIDRVLVASGDDEILDLCATYGLERVRTFGDHRTGTDRAAEVARVDDADIILVVQGDEPFVDPRGLERLCSAFQNPATQMATLAHSTRDEVVAYDPHRVKVVCNRAGNALYFSRALIPHVPATGSSEVNCLIHQGVYGFRRAQLLSFSQLPRGRLEVQESLEQLRALENGIDIMVLDGGDLGIGVDTKADLEAAQLYAEALHGTTEA